MRPSSDAILLPAILVLRFTISWMGALFVAAPHLMRREPLPQMTGMLMFPAMLLGPSLSGIILTRLGTEKAV